MNPLANVIPTEKCVVLVGAGNAHLGFVKRWSMRPMPGVAITLVNDTAVIPYSAMVPAHLAGDYSWDEITIDLVRLCQSAGVRFVAQRVQVIDAPGQHVRFAARPPLRYDVLSLGLGSFPEHPENLHSAEGSLVMRPLSGLLGRIDALEASLRSSPHPFHLVVVGAGASGCELALAIHQRLHHFAGFRLTLLQGDARLLPQFPERTAQTFARALQERQIPWRVQARVTGSDNGYLRLEDGERVAFDAVLWATQAAPPRLLRASGLAVDAHGFLQVKETLQSLTEPAIFGTGDCVAFPAYPELPRNGVHAVRQGAVLFDNVASFLKGRALRPFQPQRYCLYLLSTADGQAVLNYGPLTWRSHWARKLKNWIDRAWMRKFTPRAPLPEHAAADVSSPLMRCGGCGSKISSDVLSAVLKRIDLPDDPRVLLGCRSGEDAAVHRMQPELFSAEPDRLLEVQTVDYFKAFTDDPYVFGRVAALHAVSDLYAMNARPFSALAIATLPYARGPIQEAQLYELLTGAVETFRQLGVVLTGGHTTEGHELALGFAVTGHAEEGRLFQKSQLQVGDRLILTKPIGSGALLAAWMRGECKAGWYESLLTSMLLPNAAAADLFAHRGIRACTDVTGFGLAGHLLEMLDASQVSARLIPSALPLHRGFEQIVARGMVSSLHEDNAKMSCRVIAAAALPAWLFDPQTSGGMLAGVPAEVATPLLQALHQAGYHQAAMIGEVIPREINQPPTLILQEHSEGSIHWASQAPVSQHEPVLD